jgi:hypothetical protein
LELPEHKNNLWRESAFALHLLRQVVNPYLKLARCLCRWRQISQQLAEPPRRRRNQLQLLALS